MGEYWVQHLGWRVVEQNQKDMGGWLAGLIVGWVVNLGLVLCAANNFHQEAVEKSVELIQWIEMKIFVTS